MSSHNDNNNKLVELFDWIVNSKHIRGSRREDSGFWLHTSSKPKYFNPVTRVLELEDGIMYLIKKNTACTALGLDKTSETFLSSLPSK